MMQILRGLSHMLDIGYLPLAIVRMVVDATALARTRLQTYSNQI